MNPRCLSRLLGAVAALVVLPFAAFTAPADLDTGFGTAGKVTTDFGGRNDLGQSVVVQSDGKIVVAGNSFNGSNDDFALVRYNADGALDSSFGTGGKVVTDFGGFDDAGNSAVVQSDGKIVVAGFASGSNLDFALVRYNADGTLDGSFGTGGKVTTDLGGYNDVADRVALQSDGKIVVAGDSFNGTNSNYDFALVRYNADGTLDSSFGTGGKVTTDFSTSQDYGRSVVLQSDGKIVVAGYSGAYPVSDIALVRYTAAGALDSSFGTGGKVITDFAGFDDVGYSVALQSDGKILVAGYSLTSYYDSALVRYNADGTLDSGFGTGGKVTTDFGSFDDLGLSVAVQADGKIVVAGYSSIASNTEGFALARYTTGGALDTRFGTGGKVITGFGSSHDVGRGLVLQSDGKIVVAGYSGSTPNYDFALVRYLGGEAPPAPEIDVQQPVGTSIASGGSADFGSVNVGGTADLTFTIANNGNADLTLSGAPDMVAVDGDDANLFTVTMQPTSPVAAGGTTTFTVRFAPTDVGTRSATLTIASNDSARSPFTITLEAAAVLAAPLNTTFLAAGGITADAAPGAGVFIGLPGDAKLANFNAPAIDDRGAIAFVAKWTSATGGVNGRPTKGTGLFLDGECLALVGGDASSIAPNAKWKSFSDPVLDGQGRLACIAALSGVPKNASSVVVATTTGTSLVKIVQAGDPATGDGAKFKSFKAVAYAGTRLAVLTQLAAGTGTDPRTTAANDLGVWFQEPGNGLLALREHDSAGGKTIKTLVSFLPGNGSPGCGRGYFMQPSGGGGAQIGALAKFTDGTQGLIVQDVTEADFTPLSLSGDAATGLNLGGSFASYSVPARNRDETTAFLGKLTIANGVTKADAPGIFTGPDVNGKFKTVIRSGVNAGQAGPGAKFGLLKDPVLSESGDLAFPASVTGVKGLGAQTLWWKPAGEALALLAQAGPANPNAAPTDLPTGAQWKALQSLAIAANRGPLFIATLVPGKGGVLATTASGVWAMDFDGKLRTLFRTGDQIDVGVPGTPVLKKVKSFTLLKASVGSPGVTRSFNLAQQVVWLATFIDKSQAIVTTEVP
jgi:uncharacterized delta-60 repeat protein